MKRKIVIEVICFFLIILFVYTAVNKVTDYEKFHAQIGQSPMLTAFSAPIAVSVPAVEIMISIMLMIPKLRLAAFYSAFSMMTMFTTYIVIILNFSPFVPCSCGGVLEILTWNEHLIFNGAFLLMALTGIYLQSTLQHDNTDVEAVRV
jgi:hypothetical protein